MGDFLEVAKVLVKPTEKLIDAVQGAIGKAYEPRHIRKMADAKAYEIAAIGQAMRDSSDIPIVYDKGTVGMDTTDFDNFVKRTQSRLAYQELTKQHNIETVVDQAYEILDGEDDVSSKPVDADWMLRFFNSVQDVSSEQMQELWAKILAGEIRKPSTYSLRTLDAIHNISSEEAEIFQRLCCFKVRSGCHIFIPDEEELYEKYKINFEDVLRMEECGLLNATGFLTLNKTIPAEGGVLFKSTSNVITATPKMDNITNLSLSHYPFTSSGVEISKIFTTANNDAYILDYARIIKRKNNNVVVSAHKMISEDEKSVTYEREDLLV